MDLATIGQRYPEQLYQSFFVQLSPVWAVAPVQKDDAEILAYIWQSIFKGELIAMRHEKLRNLPQFTTSREEIRKRLLESFTVEEILARLTLEERLKGLKPEDVLKGLKPEDVLKEFRPEEILKWLKPEELLTMLSKSQLEQLKKFLKNQS